MSQSEFDFIIRRFDINDTDKCLDAATALLDTPPPHPFDVLYITLIHPVITQNLPLFIIRSHSDIPTVRAQLAAFDKSLYVEVYLSPFKTNGTVWGRIDFGNQSSPRHNEGLHIVPVFGDLFPHITPINLELTCGASCREINLYPNITQAYMLFHKRDKPFPFTLKETIIANPDREYIVKASGSIIRLLPLYQKRLLDFTITLKSIGAKGVSFDFMYDNNTLFFWDFDTDDDNKILSILENNKI